MIAVTDPTGAMVPHALIEVSPAPANAKEMYTGPDGKFTIHLTPGTYEVFVTAAGFRRWTRQVEVQAGASQMVGVKLSFAPNSGPIAVQCATPDCTTPASQDFDGHSWWEHIKFLADDKLEGRDTGSRGEREAEKYAVEQLKKAGAEPAGVDGFYQPVKFVSRRIVEKDSSLTLIRDGKREPLVLGEDANISSRVMPAPKVKAQLVFAGYGLKVPETSYDDFAGIDLHGKIAVIFSGSPSQIPGALASHYQTMAERWKSLRAAGAIGVVSLINPASMDIPWSRIALNRNHPSMDLDYPEFNETEGDQLAVLVNPASAEKLFAGSGHTFAEIAALGKDRLPMPHFALAISLEAKTKVEVTRVESANIVAKLPGSDPALKDEYVVLSAHIDHIGIGEPINGDRIYNGAMDNGSGSALVLDMAESFKAASRKAAPLDPSGSRYRRRKRPARLEILRGPSHRAAQVDGGRHKRRHVPPYRPAQGAHRRGPRGVRPRRRGPRGGAVAGREGAARSRAAAQRLYPQRSIQLHSPRRAVHHDGCRRRAWLARNKDIQRLADHALSRAL